MGLHNQAICMYLVKEGRQQNITTLRWLNFKITVIIKYSIILLMCLSVYHWVIFLPLEKKGASIYSFFKITEIRTSYPIFFFNRHKADSPS